MECFNDLLLKLREVHERELEGWQVKVQELSNKKGCDTKRMEELFNRNQQMKEQQRLLTENIKTLENRLRAGLCDRCTVTQEIAKKRQQDYEASHMQSLQHMSLLAGEMNNLKKENKRLRDEIKNLRAALSKRNNSDHFSNMSTTPEVKPNSSPDLSLPPVPVALIATATGRGSNQPSDESVAVKTETDKRSEDSEQQQQQLKGVNRSHFEPYKHFSLSALTLPSRRPEPIVTRVAEKRVPSVEGLEQRPPILSHALLFKNSSSSSGAEMNPSRHVLHAPVPCRPQPIKSSPVTLPWSLSESCDWVNAAAAGTMFQPSSKTNLPAFSNQMTTSQHGSPRRNMSPWHKQNVSQSSPKEPTVVFRIKNLAEHVKSPTAPPEKKEIPPFKTERASTWLREANEGPLDLSDRAKPKSSQTPQDDSPLTLQGGETIQQSPDKDVKTNPCPYVPVSSPSPVIACSSSSTSPAKQQEEELSRDQNHKIIKEQEQKEELNGKTSQNSDKKVPVLTISLRPVVVLETLNSALKKQESISNGKQLSPALEPGSSSDEGESVSAQESSQRCKRKRSSVETEADIDSDTDNAQHERKIKIT
ncbi:RBBP8 N-terminal-like protein [Channa argus]|uniref:RBBP8 N-terminal-like protein n=1 Tax=Channa argus TaxID=215402 RepID=A0A6G1Q1W4_CHAAH|nr:RBBP8 N-terminal-like protein [Channa argus]